MKTKPAKFRILLSAQTVAGVALLALAVPYSGCFTGRVWNDDTVLIAAGRQGRLEFRGNLDDRLVNAGGDTAYPGTMDFETAEGRLISKKGWLIVPAAFRESWTKNLNHYEVRNLFSAPPVMRNAGEQEPHYILVNPKPVPDELGWGYHSTQKFTEANAYPFRTEEEGFSPESSGYNRQSPEAVIATKAVTITNPFENITGLTANGELHFQDIEGTDIAHRQVVVTEEPAPVHFRLENGGTANLGIGGAPVFSMPVSGPFVIVYNPLVRTGWSDGLNTTGKVLLTLPAVAGDVVTTAVVTGGVVVAGGVLLVTAPFVAIGEAVSKPSKDMSGEPAANGCPNPAREPETAPDEKKKPERPWPDRPER